MRVPFTDLAAQQKCLQPELDRAWKEVTQKARFIGGESVQRFEESFAAAVGSAHAIGTGNGTDALLLSLKVLGIGPGDAVATAANSFIASSEAITLSGAEPVFIDVDPHSYLMDLDALEKHIQGQGGTRNPIKAVIPVHLYGLALDMPRLMDIAHKYNLRVIEDAAQAHLARINGKHTGTWGDLGCFSFFPGKNLGAFGDAGAIVTDDSEKATRLRQWRNHGRLDKHDHAFEGTNSRLDALQAAILQVKLPHLADWNKKRRNHARRYIERLKTNSSIILPVPMEEDRHVFHLFVIQVEGRQALQAALQDRGIETSVHYPVALPNLTAYKRLGYQRGDFPTATRLQDRILSLPMFPELTPDQIDYVCDTLNAVCMKAVR
jgi:dTDP-4-amino-4,6-dideoxygalactose transaminase